jgi:hypothetical protein
MGTDHGVQPEACAYTSGAAHCPLPSVLASKDPVVGCAARLGTE